MLRKVKLGLLRASEGLEISRRVLGSAWRRKRLLILCYHGISMEDEHEWRPALYMSPDLLTKRFTFLAEAGCNVLPLGEALRLLYRRDLPPRSVAITFDDGDYNFYTRALPILKSFHFPATIYLPTYYTCFNQPVFDVAVDYVLWKMRGHTMYFPEVLEQPVVLDSAGIANTVRAVRDYASQAGLSGAERHFLLHRVATAAGADFEEICAKRILHQMTPEEVAEVAMAGMDFQLHTHGHRVFDEKSLFQDDLAQNRSFIEEMTGSAAVHFCYPGGFTLPQFSRWLREMEVESATTCDAGLPGECSDRFNLPRYVDTSGHSMAEFISWVSGVAATLPRRSATMPQDQLVSMRERREAPVSTN
jgi:peptidoglycan/xylan/chitin deacetylase (PgdA/CDA1 family)